MFHLSYNAEMRRKMEKQVFECITITLHQAMARERERGNLREKEQRGEEEQIQN